jgi:hypothetical protein
MDQWLILNQNQQSDYQDAMKDIRETTQYREQMNLNVKKVLSKSCSWKIID